MRIPGGPETVDAYLTRLADLLKKPTTLVFFDASYLLWLSGLGPVSQKQFIEWAERLGDRALVPVWAATEYYKHLQKKTVPTRVRETSAKLNKAVNAFVETARPLSDWPTVRAGQVAPDVEGGIAALMTHTEKLREAVTKWGEAAESSTISEWINAHRVHRSNLLALLPKIQKIGRARFKQEVPPGFMDRRKDKQNTDDPDTSGGNPYGDVLFWQEVITEAKQRSDIEAIVIVSNDRKKDWHHKPNGDVPEPVWGKLRKKWPPVPAPHPFLHFELESEVSGSTLSLIDSTYLGALLWSQERSRCNRFVAMSIGVTENALIHFRQQTLRTLKRAKRMPRQEAERILQLMLGGDGALTREMDDLLQTVPEQALGRFDEWIKVQGNFGKPEEFAWFAAALNTHAADEGVAAITLLDRLLHKLAEIDGEYPCAAILGILYSSYFDGADARDVPRSPRLDEVLTYQNDGQLEHVVAVVREALVLKDSKALYLPNIVGSAIHFEFRHANDRGQGIAELQQIYIDQKAILTAEEHPGADELTKSFNGDSRVSIRLLVDAASRRYGLPSTLVERTKLPETAVWQVPPGIYFETPDQIRSSQVGSDEETDDEDSGDDEFGEEGEEEQK